MHIERASEDIYIFTSDRYAQVTASLIVSGNTGVLIDAMPYPEEAAQIALLAHRRCPDGVRYIIYTGHEADHTYGAYLFPKAEVIAHSLCRQQLIEHGQAALEHAKNISKEFEHVTLRIPSITFDQGTFTLRLPGKTLEIMPTPGHTQDSLAVLLHEERLLFAGDTIMAVPTIARGNVDQLRESINKVANMQLESIVQGHGEIILRGEIKEMMRRSVAYLDNLQAKVHRILESGASRDVVKNITIESCGLSRVLLNGVVVQLHIANALAMYDRMKGSVAVNPNAAPYVEETEVKPSKSKSAKKTEAAKPAEAAASAPATTAATPEASAPTPTPAPINTPPATATATTNTTKADAPKNGSAKKSSTPAAKPAAAKPVKKNTSATASNATASKPKPKTAKTAKPSTAKPTAGTARKKGR